MSKMQTDTSKVCSGTIKLIGVGNTGCKLVSQMARNGLNGADFILVNSDFNYKTIKEATYITVDEINRNELTNIFKETNMVIIVAGMGGRIGTKYTGEIAEIAKATGALTIGIVTKPFNFEGVIRSQVADRGTLQLIKKVDSLFIVPNNQVTSSIVSEGDLNGTFELSDTNIEITVNDIVNIINAPGVINIGIDGMKDVMKNAGLAWIASGIGKKDNPCVNAVNNALFSLMFNVPLYYNDTNDILFKITGGDKLTLFEVNQATDVLKQSFHPDTNIIFGVGRDSDMEDAAEIIVIGTNRVRSPEQKVV